MSHWRTMFDAKYVGAWDLPAGRDAVCIIEGVRAETLKNATSQAKKPVIKLRGKEKLFVCNKTNAKTIAGLYGNDVSEWVGKAIALYATTTSAGGETVECIRVRNRIPEQQSPKRDDDPVPAQELGADEEQ